MRKTSKIVAIIMLFTVLSACTASIEEEQVVAKEATSTAFTNEEAVEVNYKGEGIEFYLPSGAEVNKTTENNVVFEKKGKVFILFTNPHEGLDSKVVYESSQSSAIDYVVNETFEQDGKFGFMLVQEDDEDSYEMTVGVGGVKVTTITDVKELAKDAELMMQIATTAKK